MTSTNKDGQSPALSLPLVRLRWHCGCYVGQPKWQNCDDYEPDECDTDFETQDHDQETWDEKSCSATCPTCGAELTQKFDAPELLPNVQDQTRPL